MTTLPSGATAGLEATAPPVTRAAGRSTGTPGPEVAARRVWSGSCPNCGQSPSAMPPPATARRSAASAAARLHRIRPALRTLPPPDEPPTVARAILRHREPGWTTRSASRGQSLRSAERGGEGGRCAVPVLADEGPPAVEGVAPVGGDAGAAAPGVGGREREERAGQPVGVDPVELERREERPRRAGRRLGVPRVAGAQPGQRPGAGASSPSATVVPQSGQTTGRPPKSRGASKKSAGRLPAANRRAAASAAAPRGSTLRRRPRPPHRSIFARHATALGSLTHP